MTKVVEDLLAAESLEEIHNARGIRQPRGAGVSFEDRQDLLGHRSARITTHYSAAELSRLIEAANSVCETRGKTPEFVVLRRLSVS